MQRFRFRYTLFTVDAQLGPDLLVAKTGIKVVSVPVARLTHLYIHDRKDADHLELLLGYRKRAGGRVRRARLFADREQPGFIGLVDALLARRPEIDIRGVHYSEAFRQVGAVEAEWLVIPGVMAAGCLVVAFFFMPLLVHGLDIASPARVSVAALAAGERPQTRNVVLTDVRLTDASIRIERASTRRVVAWVALAGRDEPDPARVHVVLEVDGTDPKALERAKAATELPGVLRDVWWESPDQKQRNRFASGAGVSLAPEVVLVEYEGSRRGDLFISVAVLGFLAGVTVLVFLALRARRPRHPAG